MRSGLAGNVVVAVTASAEGMKDKRQEERKQERDEVRYHAVTSIAMPTRSADSGRQSK